MDGVTRHFRKYIYHYLAGIITTLFALCFFLFPLSLGRLIESIRDLGTSFGYAFAELFEMDHNVTATVNDFAKIPFFENWTVPTPKAFIPPTWEEFTVAWDEYWVRFIDSENFGGYLSLL